MVIYVFIYYNNICFYILFLYFYNNICFYIFIITYVFIFLLGICFYQKKRVKEKYQKILEKSNSCFPTSKNSFRIFRGSFCFFFRSYPKLFSPISPNSIDKKLSNHPPKSQISYFFTKIANL